VKHQGLRVIIVFEGRDAAGKGGTIKVITERVGPRCLPRCGPAGALGQREEPKEGDPIVTIPAQ